LNGLSCAIAVGTTRTSTTERITAKRTRFFMVVLQLI
jgi:hypothetical protein